MTLFRHFRLGALLLSLAASSLQAINFASRDEIPDRYKWDFSLFYPSWEAWEADLEIFGEEAAALAAMKGTLGDGPEALRAVYEQQEAMSERLWRLFGYVGSLRDTDQRDNAVQERHGRFWAAYGAVAPTLSWIEPELLTLPEDTVMEWVRGDEKLREYAYPIANLFRLQDHVLEGDKEELLAHYQPVFGGARRIYEALTTADGETPEVTLSDGTVFTVTPASYGEALNTFSSAADRRLVQEARMESFIERRNTFAAIYQARVEASVSTTRARGYESVVHSHLQDDNVPVEVLETLVATAKRAAPIVARYHALRAEALELEDYGWSDFFVPLVDDGGEWPYDTVVEAVVASVAPLGASYQAKLREQFEGGLVDVYETPGKRSGAYNRGVYGVGSFVLLNHRDTLDNAFTVAHEMGHSMHTRLAMEHQPYATHRYKIFVAEVAAIFNEKLFLQHLLAGELSPAQRVALLEKQIQDIMGTFYLQTMMADYELRAHRLVEAGGALTADGLTALWQELATEYFGEAIPAEDSYRYSWARIPHLFNSPFYVYQYATCYASAATLLQEMQATPAGEAREVLVERFLTLLRSGGNDDPMALLKKAGIDLSDPATVASVVEEFEVLVDRFAEAYAELRETEAEAVSGAPVAAREGAR